MATTNRAATITKAHKILKKHYRPVSPPADRPLLEHLMYACCLENARVDAADEAFAKVTQLFYDWNEIRVTAVSELAEVIGALPDPQAAARRLKSTLQSVFETHYSFDLEFLKKQNIGKSVKHVEGYNGITPFAIAYLTQNALGGHAIAVDRGVLDVFSVLGVISESEYKKQQVPGLERAVPKSKGVEFASLIHQLGADYFVSPFSPRVRGILVEIEPDAKARLPKRGAKQAEVKGTGKSKAAKPRKKTKSKTAAKSAGAGEKQTKPRRQPAKKASAAAEKTTEKKSSATKKLGRKKPR